MKYTLAAILIAYAVMLVWACRSGGLQFALIMTAALAAISFCGMLPILFSIRSRARETQFRPTKHNTNQIVVREDDTAS